MLPKEKPCEKCIHKNVCEARNKYEDIDIKITHPFFTAKIVCSQFQENKPTPRIIGEQPERSYKMFGFTDCCPRCGCNNAPMVWLSEQEGWICEDCLEKEVSEKNGGTKDKENSKVD